jgi:hypothetical protein
MTRVAHFDEDDCIFVNLLTTLSKVEALFKLKVPHETAECLY